MWLHAQQKWKFHQLHIILHLKPWPLRTILNILGIFRNMQNTFQLNPKTQSWLVHWSDIEHVHCLTVSVASNFRLSGYSNLLNFKYWIPFHLHLNSSIPIQLTVSQSFLLYFVMVCNEISYEIRLLPIFVSLFVYPWKFFFGPIKFDFSITLFC